MYPFLAIALLLLGSELSCLSFTCVIGLMCDSIWCACRAPHERIGSICNRIANGSIRRCADSVFTTSTPDEWPQTQPTTASPSNAWSDSPARLGCCAGPHELGSQVVLTKIMTSKEKTNAFAVIQGILSESGPAGFYSGIQVRRSVY